MHKGDLVIGEDTRAGFEAELWRGNGSLVVEGKLTVNADFRVPGNLEAGMGLVVRGELLAGGTVRAGGIEVGKGLRAGSVDAIGGIEVGGDLLSFGDVVAQNGPITVAGNLLAFGRIATPKSLKARVAFSYLFDQECSRQETTAPMFGPRFYADLPPFIDVPQVRYAKSWGEVVEPMRAKRDVILGWPLWVNYPASVRIGLHHYFEAHARPALPAAAPGAKPKAKAKAKAKKKGGR